MRDGIRTESIKLIAGCGFKQLNIERIHVRIFTDNKALIITLEKNEYQKEGVFKKEIFKNGFFWWA